MYFIGGAAQNTVVSRYHPDQIREGRKHTLSAPLDISLAHLLY